MNMSSRQEILAELRRKKAINIALREGQSTLATALYPGNDGPVDMLSPSSSCCSTASCPSSTSDSPTGHQQDDSNPPLEEAHQQLITTFFQKRRNTTSQTIETEVAQPSPEKTQQQLITMFFRTTAEPEVGHSPQEAVDLDPTAAGVEREAYSIKETESKCYTDSQNMHELLPAIETMFRTQFHAQLAYFGPYIEAMLKSYIEPCMKEIVPQIRESVTEAVIARLQPQITQCLEEICQVTESKMRQSDSLDEIRAAVERMPIELPQDVRSRRCSTLGGSRSLDEELRGAFDRPPSELDRRDDEETGGNEIVHYELRSGDQPSVADTGDSSRDSIGGDSPGSSEEANGIGLSVLKNLW